MGKKEKLSRDRTEDSVVAREQPEIERPALPLEAMVMCGPVLPIRSTSGSVVLQQLGSKLMPWSLLPSKIMQTSMIWAEV